jgi:predicted amidohydrolase
MIMSPVSKVIKIFILFILSMSIIPFTCMLAHANGIDNDEQLYDWTFQVQRSELAPLYWIDDKVLFDGKPTLAISGQRKAYVNGSWSCAIDVIPGNYYEFVSYIKPQNITDMDRSVLAQITWLDDNGDQVEFIEFPATCANPFKQDWYIIQQVYQVPEKAIRARIDLIYRWDPDGTVFFGGTSFNETGQPPSRPVRIAAIHHRPENTTSAQDNLQEFKEYIDIAGGQNADIVCLPEGITIVGTQKSYVEVSERIPGPSTQFLGQLAKKHNMYIVAGIYEREGPIVYNTSVLIGRDGQLQGKYRKTALPREEISGGITPGESFPVFDTDFGRIGMMICWDVSFPEPARMLALQGAEIIFMPIWGGNMTLASARAIENQIYLVSSTYDMKTGVFNKKGELVVEGTIEDPVAILDVDLNQRELWWWLGEFRNRIKRELPSSKAIKYRF